MDSTLSEHHHKKKKKKSTTTVAKPVQDVKMDYVPSRDGLARPFVAYFPTGFDPISEADHGDGAAALASVKAYQGVEKLKAKQTQLVASTHSQVDFVGMNYAGEAAAWQPCSYALGVYDKEKCTLQLVPLAGEKVAYFSFFSSDITMFCTPRLVIAFFLCLVGFLGFWINISTTGCRLPFPSFQECGYS